MVEAQQATSDPEQFLMRTETKSLLPMTGGGLKEAPRTIRSGLAKFGVDLEALLMIESGPEERLTIESDLEAAPAIVITMS